MAGFRDANLLIIALSAHAQTVQAGVGVSPDTIQPPSITLPTVAYVKSDTAQQSSSNRRWSDYSFQPKPDLTPLPIFAFSSTNRLDLQPHSPPCSWVTDWKALDAFFRYLLFHCLKLPKPPLAQHILLSIPPNIPNIVRDKLTQLFFENLQAPALYLVESPILQILACNATSGIIVDIGCRSTLVSYVSDSILLTTSCHQYPLGEQDCDNYLISLLLNNDPDLPSRLGFGPGDAPDALYYALCSLVNNLKSMGHIRFGPQLKHLKSCTSLPGDTEEEGGITDVAQAIVSGKADKIIGRQLSNNSNGTGMSNALSRRSTQQGRRLEAEILKETDVIIVSATPSSQPTGVDRGCTPTSPNLDNSPAPTITLYTDFGPVQIPADASYASETHIPKIRHQHAEPLFSPGLLRTIPLTFGKFGLAKWAGQYEDFNFPEDHSLVESIKHGLLKVSGAEQRREVAENFLVTGSWGGMCQSEGLSAGLAGEVKFVAQALLNMSLPSPQAQAQMQTQTQQGQGVGSGVGGEGFKPVKVPEYFSELKGRNDWSEYLGGCVVGKLVFNDASCTKLWMSKPDYSQEGPYVCRKPMGVGSF